MGVIKCAFCKGKGKDYFDLLSGMSSCQVCGGTGKVEVMEPMIKCAYCNGTGVPPHNGRVTCTVCNGKGSVPTRGATDECLECKGTGQSTDGGLPCIKCRGKGVIVNS